MSEQNEWAANLASVADQQAAELVELRAKVAEQDVMLTRLESDLRDVTNRYLEQGTAALALVKLVASYPREGM